MNFIRIIICERIMVLYLEKAIIFKASMGQFLIFIKYENIEFYERKGGKKHNSKANLDKIIKISHKFTLNSII